VKTLSIAEQSASMDKLCCINCGLYDDDDAALQAEPWAAQNPTYEFLPAQLLTLL
jgi:hypothetical protein